MANVKPIPDGYHTLTPHMICKGAEKALDFYKKAFGAEELCRMPGPDGTGVMHAEIKIGDSHLMMCDEFPGMEHCKSPQSLGGSPVTLHLYVTDVDTAFKKAIDAGCTAEMPPTDMFWGDRYGKLRDPFGHNWSIATHIADPTPEEMAKGAEEAFKHCGQ